MNPVAECVEHRVLSGDITGLGEIRSSVFFHQIVSRREDIPPFFGVVIRRVAGNDGILEGDCAGRDIKPAAATGNIVVESAIGKEGIAAFVVQPTTIGRPTKPLSRIGAEGAVRHRGIAVFIVHSAAKGHKGVDMVVDKRAVHKGRATADIIQAAAWGRATLCDDEAVQNRGAVCPAGCDHMIAAAQNGGVCPQIPVIPVRFCAAKAAINSHAVF